MSRWLLLEGVRVNHWIDMFGVAGDIYTRFVSLVSPTARLKVWLPLLYFKRKIFYLVYIFFIIVFCNNHYWYLIMYFVGRSDRAIVYYI